MKTAWPQASLGELLRLERRRVDVHPDEQYEEIGIYCFGRGIFHKPPRMGLEVGDKDLFLLKEGDFILQVTFAWEGAVAIVSAAEDGMYGSTRYPTFRVNETRCFPQFLLHYFKTENGLQQLVKICPGSAGRNRVLSIKRIPEVLVPLPPLVEQRRIVVRIEELTSKVQGVRALRQEAAEEAEALDASLANTIFNSEHIRRWPMKSLDEISEIRSGVTLGRVLMGKTVRLPYLRVANVQDGHLNLSRIKEIEVLESEAEKWELRSGDLLLTEGGDWDKLGRCAVWREEIPNCIHQNHIFRVRTNPADFAPEFLRALIGSPMGKAYFQEASKQTTNLASINQRQLRAFQVFQPPLREQQRILSNLETVREKRDALQALQARTSTELDALMPSILDKAFRGEL